MTIRVVSTTAGQPLKASQTLMKRDSSSSKVISTKTPVATPETQYTVPGVLIASQASMASPSRIQKWWSVKNNLRSKAQHYISKQLTSAHTKTLA